MSSWHVRTPRQLLRELVEKAQERWERHMLSARLPFEKPPEGKIGEFTTNLDEKDSALIKQITSDDANADRWPSKSYQNIDKVDRSVRLAAKHAKKNN